MTRMDLTWELAGLPFQPSGSSRRSTSFAEEKSQVNLAISLHAANDELRSSLLPVNKKYPVADLIAACRNYVEQTHRRITFEWALDPGSK